MNKNSTVGLPDALFTLLAQADKQRGFPEGTMVSVMQQESGGNSKYIDAPDTYHYDLNAEGKRIAGHTGKVSTAFGPFGILESTGRDPGYGVQPLKDKSLEEQVRFAGDYLAARSKQAGGLQAGLSGYGEGGKYGQQVMARIGKQATPIKPLQVTPMELPQTQVAMMEPQAPVVQPIQQAIPVLTEQVALVPQQQANPWAEFQKAIPVGLQADALDYSKVMPQLNVGKSQPNFLKFKSWLDNA